MGYHHTLHMHLASHKGKNRDLLSGRHRAQLQCSKAPRCPAGWDAKAEAKDGPKYRAEFLARRRSAAETTLFAPKMEYVACAHEQSVQSTNG